MFAFFKKLMSFKNALPPLKEVLSEDGVGSYSRYSGFIIITSTVFWVTYLVLKNHALPDLEGPAIFIASGQTQYAANQVKHVARAIKGDPNPAPGTPDPQGDANATQS